MKFGAADEKTKFASPQNKVNKDMKTNSLSLTDNFPSDIKSKHRDSHDFIMNFQTSDNFLQNKRKEEKCGELFGKRSHSKAIGKDQKIFKHLPWI